MSEPMTPEAWNETPCIPWQKSLRKGYGQTRANGTVRYAHVVAWESVHGPVPDGYELDHQCHNRSCVNVLHLRLATRSQNMANMAKRAGTASRYKGVTWHEGRRCWRARITVNYQERWIGCFRDEDEAARAYDQTATEAFGAHAHTNFGEER